MGEVALAKTRAAPGHGEGRQRVACMSSRPRGCMTCGKPSVLYPPASSTPTTVAVTTMAPTSGQRGPAGRGHHRPSAGNEPPHRSAGGAASRRCSSAPHREVRTGPSRASPEDHLGWTAHKIAHRRASERPPSGSREAVSRSGSWSGRQDSNLRPLDPQSSALPGCATPRPNRLSLPKGPFSPIERPLASPSPASSSRDPRAMRSASDCRTSLPS